MFVVFRHSIPYSNIYSLIWVNQAVPLFIFITAYLTFGNFERGRSISDYYSAQSVFKILKRIFIPFLLLTALQCAIFAGYGK